MIAIDAIKAVTPHIRVPGYLVQNFNITNAKTLLLYGVLLSLNQVYPTVTVSNSKLASMLGFKSRNFVSKSLDNLSAVGAITMNYSKGANATTKSIITNIKPEKNDFISVPWPIVKAESEAIRSTQKLILGVIYTNAFKHSSSESYITNAEIAQQIGHRTRSVIYAIKKLVMQGYIVRHVDDEGNRVLAVNQNLINSDDEFANDFFTSRNIQNPNNLSEPPF